MKAREAMTKAWKGFIRPFTLLAGLRADGPAWRRFWLTSLAQVLLTLTMAVLLVAIGGNVNGEDARAPTLEVALKWSALLWSALISAQWVTLALTREFMNPVARALCGVAGITPEDDETPPRVHLDGKWLKKKVKQRLRGLLVLLPGYATFVPILLVTRAVGLDNFVMPPLMFAWTFYWWCAFTAGRSARAWRDTSGTLPAPVRWWLARTQSTFGFRWFLPRWLGRFAVWASTPDSAPAVAMEHDPATFVGLGLARMLLSLPLLRLFFRVAVDMAAAEALERGPA